MLTNIMLIEKGNEINKKNGCVYLKSILIV
jgi:hypothetical protein